MRGLEEEKLQAEHGGEGEGWKTDWAEAQCPRLSYEIELSWQQPWGWVETLPISHVKRLRLQGLLIYQSNDSLTMICLFPSSSKPKCTSMYYYIVCNRYKRHKQKIIKFHHLVE